MTYPRRLTVERLPSLHWLAVEFPAPHSFNQEIQVKASGRRGVEGCNGSSSGQNFANWLVKVPNLIDNYYLQWCLTVTHRNFVMGKFDMG